MLPFALLLGPDGTYYVRNKALIEHVCGLTYKLGKSGIHVELICLNENWRVLDELRNNMQADRSSLENRQAHITARNVAEYPIESSRNEIAPRDMSVLSTYLASKMYQYGESLQETFSLHVWRALTEVTLIYILIHNRIRYGELEQMLKLDYQNHRQTAIQGRTGAEGLFRFEIQGKLHRSVSVIIDGRMKKCIDIILEHAETAGVNPENPYVFGIPNHHQHSFPFLHACGLLQKFAFECGAENPELLRVTNLRIYNMATQQTNMDLET